jgi:anti-sigma B factor antagonist
LYFPTDVLEDDVTVIRAHGRLNMLTAPRLERTIQRALDGGDTRIVLDLAEVDFLDSTGLSVMILGMKEARSGGGDLRLVAPGPQVSLVLQLTKLDRVLLAFDDATAAWAA